MHDTSSRGKGGWCRRPARFPSSCDTRSLHTKLSCLCPSTGLAMPPRAARVACSSSPKATELGARTQWLGRASASRGGTARSGAVAPAELVQRPAVRAGRLASSAVALGTCGYAIRGVNKSADLACSGPACSVLDSREHVRDGAWGGAPVCVGEAVAQFCGAGAG